VVCSNSIVIGVPLMIAVVSQALSKRNDVSTVTMLYFFDGLFLNNASKVL